MQRDAAQRSDHPAELREANSAALQLLRQEFSDGVESIELGACQIVVQRGSVTDAATDAIVNAANETLEGGGGVDLAVHAAAGPGLLAECVAIEPTAVQRMGGALHVGELARCPVGEVRVTGAHEIPLARWVLHTVAPLYGEGEAFRFDELNRCYSECLRAAAANGARSIAFCALGTGFYGWPEVVAAGLAVRAVFKWAAEQDELQQQPTTSPPVAPGLAKIVFTTWGEQQHDVYTRVLAREKRNWAV